MKNKSDDYKKRFQNGFDILCRGNKHRFQVWTDIITVFAITISNNFCLWYKENEILKKTWEKREQQYLKIINSYSEKERKLFPQMFALLVQEYEKNPNQDLLGSIYMDLGLGNKNAGQFFTPYNLCECMAKLSMDKKTVAKQVHEKGYISILDCTCGAGATLIGAAHECSEMFKKLDYKNHVYFVGMDIDSLVAMMCYIQLSLLGVAGYVIVTDTLANPDINFMKDSERVWLTPYYVSRVWTMRRFAHGLNIFMQERKENENTNKIKSE